MFSSSSSDEESLQEPMAKKEESIHVMRNEVELLDDSSDDEITDRNDALSATKKSPRSTICDDRGSRATNSSPAKTSLQDITDSSPSLSKRAASNSPSTAGIKTNGKINRSQERKTVSKSQKQSSLQARSPVKAHKRLRSPRKPSSSVESPTSKSHANKTKKSPSCKRHPNSIKDHFSAKQAGGDTHPNSTKDHFSAKQDTPNKHRKNRKRLDSQIGFVQARKPRRLEARSVLSANGANQASKRSLSAKKMESVLSPRKKRPDAKNDSNATLELLKSHCWTCRVPLLRFYAMHAHPVLEVPTCSVCCQVAYEAVFEQDACSACGKETDAFLLLCDSCPRAFCSDCVDQAHGDHEMAHALSNSNDEWDCLVCNAPLGLQNLQQALVQAEKNDSATKVEVSTETLVEQLAAVEQELDRCYAMDNDAFRDTKRAEIAQELADNSNVEERVKAEMQLLERQWTEHQRRVADYVTTLQEEVDARLKKECGTSLLAYYKTEERYNVPEQEPAWKVEADAELDELYKQQGLQQGRVPGGKTVSEPKVYEQDLDDESSVEIEDISTLEECMSVVKKKAELQNQWSLMSEESVSSLGRKVKKALRFEDMMLEEKNIRIRQLNDKEDEAELQRDQRSTVSGGGSVRRDELFLRKKSDAVRSRSNSAEAEGARNWSRDDTIVTEPAKERKKRRVTPLLVSPGKANSVVETSESEVPIIRGGSRNVFDDSDLILTPPGADRIVSIATSVAKQLKQVSF